MMNNSSQKGRANLKEEKSKIQFHRRKESHEQVDQGHRCCSGCCNADPPYLHAAGRVAAQEQMKPRMLLM